LVLECGQWRMNVLTDDAGLAPAGKHGLAIAIDLGTTTIAAQMIDLASGNVLAVETGLNPQAAHGSDVMSRILAVLNGADLTTGIRAALGLTVDRLARGRQAEIAEVILVGNTVMHHLFSGLSVEPLAHVPFESPHLAEQRFTARQLGWNLSDTCTIRFARCLGGFVGADTLAGIVATGIARGDCLIALVDLGTNGEIAIGNRSGVVCASTAAGPAFEAGSIRMGMRAVTGAISHVELVDRSLRSTVIGDVEPRGICGSGLVGAVAAGLTSGAILASGRVAGEHEEFFPCRGRWCSIRPTFANCSWPRRPSPRESGCCSTASAPAQAIFRPFIWLVHSAIMCRSRAPTGSASSKRPANGLNRPATQPCAEQRCCCWPAKTLRCHRSSTSASPPFLNFRMNSPAA
jgi:hypothetical protein